jgi:chromosome segregation ATPase
MSQTTILEKLKEELRMINETLAQLEAQRREIEEAYLTILDEENKIIEEMRKCRDPYKYGQLEIKFNAVSRRRRELESRKTEIERKMRGCAEEKSRIQMRIEYLKPKPSQN